MNVKQQIKPKQLRVLRSQLTNMIRITKTQEVLNNAEHGYIILTCNTDIHRETNNTTLSPWLWSGHSDLPSVSVQDDSLPTFSLW